MFFEQRFPKNVLQLGKGPRIRTANMIFEISSSSVIPTFPTATPKHSTFFSWNLIVDLTSVIFAFRSSLWEIGVGNLPAVARFSVSERFKKQFYRDREKTGVRHTLGKTWAQKTRDLLNQGIGGNKGVVFTCELLDQLLVLVELLQVVGRHGINAMVLSTVDVVLISKYADMFRKY